MSLRFLVDECLSLRLVPVAHAAGHEAYHVSHRGWNGLTDWILIRKAKENDFTLVTANGVDFKKLYRKEMLHAGIIILPGQLFPRVQCELFAAALEEIGTGDLTNLVLEVELTEGEAVLTRYQLPPTE